MGNESLSDQTCTNQAICGAKMKCEQEMSAMSHDLDEMVAEAGMSEEKAQRAMIDAARLADELRMEQEAAMGLERDKKLLEAQEIAALNLAKFRQVQANLTGSNERADLNEQALAKTRARARSSSIGPM